jgi:hypothetical protein
MGDSSEAPGLFTTAKLNTAPGNRRDLRRRAAFRPCGTCSTVELRAHDEGARWDLHPQPRR